MSISLLPIIQVYLNQYGLATCIILGNIGNGLIIYTLKNQHRNNCSIYLICAAFMNIIFITFNVPLLIYTYNYGDPTSQSLILCKIRYYFPHVIGQIGRYAVVLASIDRYAITSANGRLRVLSQPFMARNLLIVMSLVLGVFAIHLVIFTTISNGRCGQFSPYFNYYLSYTIIFTCTIPPLTMAIFGYLSYRNMRVIRLRVQPVENAPEENRSRMTIHQRDRNLLIMVLSEVVIYVLTMSIYPIILSEMAITNNINMKKSVDHQIIENFIVFISFFLSYINAAAPFYIYLIASKAFRKQVMRCFTCSRDRILGTQ